jgi:predicted dehydrogenase
MNTTGDIRLAILGCGAVTELAHLPAIERMRGPRVTLLVDINAERRDRLAASFNVENTASDLSGQWDRFDAAIIALPHAMHAPSSIELLARGKSVLVEKPMAITVAECDAMINASKQSGAVLAVGLMRRFFWSLQFAKTLIQEGVLGRIQSFDFREGLVYCWPVASDFFFRKATAGGGVLIDTGAHTLDSLLYLLGDFEDVEYFDDAEGGVDANCLLNLRLKSGVPGVVELSRTRQLRNTGIVRGERGALEIDLGANNLKFSVAGHPFILSGPVGNLDKVEQGQRHIQLMTSQIEDFVDAIKRSRSPVVDGVSARASIGLIETCYRLRKPLVSVWAPEQFSVRG